MISANNIRSWIVQRNPNAMMHSQRHVRGFMKRFVTSFLSNQSGATAIEYGLIAALIAVAAIAAMTTLGTKLGGTFNNVSNQL